MALEARPPEILCFGTFEVDLQSGELRKQGKRIRLQEQPFQVLTLLLQRPRGVVTREELQSQIWSADTFVDFDNGLNAAINKLREALGDSAENPRFIETLPRRGYRFLAPISSDGQKEPVIRPLGRKTALVVTVTPLLVAAAVGGLLWRSSRARVLTEKDTIVLGDFANSTGDPVFDGTLREGLSVQLEQSPFLSLVSEEGIHQTLRMMEQPSNARLTPEVAQEVCERTNSAAALNGSIALIGTRYNLILKAVNCANGNLLASTETQADDKSHVLDALSKAASDMRTKLGESLSTVQKYNTPLEQATTPFLEALQAYSLGFKADGEGKESTALAFYQRATQIDPNFALAYLGAAGAGESAQAIENSRKAFALRDRVSERERLMIDEEYTFWATGDLMRAAQICELATRTYPRSFIFHEDLGGSLGYLGQYESGLRESLEVLRLAPYRSAAYREVAKTNLYLNRVDEAEAVAKEARAKNLDPALTVLTDVFYVIAFYRQDTAEMARQLARVTSVPEELEDLTLALAADTAAYGGQLREAREFSRRAADSAERKRRKEDAATYRAVSDFREALFGNAAIVRRLATASRGPSSGRDLTYAVALAFAYGGDAQRARALADGLGKWFPEDTIVRFNYLPTLRAKLALLQGSPQEAVEFLEAASPYELGLPSNSLYNWPNLYPVYVRGEAYLATHQGREAAAEFQKILDHRGVVLNEPIGALAHLQLGRAYALQRDITKARAAYQDFVTLWKNADPDIPILQQAKAEYAKLQ